jgi:hypothetical protein
MSNTLLDPVISSAHDPTSDRITIVLRDGRAAAVIDMDPAKVPILINALMASVHAAKQSRKLKSDPGPTPPRDRDHPDRPAPARSTFALTVPPDLVPIRTAAPLARRRACLSGMGTVGLRGPSGGGRIRKS